MKTINVTFETTEHAQLLKLKGKTSWQDYILELANVSKGDGHENDEI